jgi:hypothetical protein
MQLVFFSYYGFKFSKQPHAEMQEKSVYIRPKVIRSFPKPCSSGSKCTGCPLIGVVADILSSCAYL